MTEARDQWHRWLLDVRHGGDAAYCEQLLARTLHPVRDKVLDRADLRPGDTLLDVGCGDGLIALGALAVGPLREALQKERHPAVQHRMTLILEQLERLAKGLPLVPTSVLLPPSPKLLDEIDRDLRRS